MEKPLISIIVPVYNSEKYLKKCLESIQKQTYPVLEIILVDDGSTDESRNICTVFADHDDRFKYVYQENGGVSKARNNGLSRASGQYIGFVDSDDWIEKDMFETLLNLSRDNNADVSIISFIDYHENKEISFKDSSDILEFNSKEAIKQMHSKRFFAGHLCNKLIKKEKADSFKLDENIAVYEDILFLSDVFKVCDKVVYQNVHKYYYRLNETSAMNDVFKKSYLSGRIACKKMLYDIKKVYPDILCYPQKTLIEADIWIVIKIIQSKEEKKYSEYIKEIRKEVKENLNKYSFNLIRSSTMKLYTISFVIDNGALKLIRKTRSGLKKMSLCLRKK